MKNKKLLNQILKFGVVGGISFLIDFIIYTAIIKILTFDKAYIIAGVLGFSISLIFNYLASMKWVFVRRDDTSRKKEFIIFLVLSVIGLGINELCLWIGIDIMYKNWAWLRSIMSESFAKDIFFKFGATGVVMVYNFITRKIFLEKKD